MDDKQAALATINELISQALALADQIGDTYLGVLLYTAFRHVTEGNATDED